MRERLFGLDSLGEGGWLRTLRLEDYGPEEVPTIVTAADPVPLPSTLLHVPSPQALVATPYGRALLMKMRLLTLVLAVGASNHLLRGRGPFGRLVVVELVLALALFLATGFLTSLPPASGA